MTVTKNIWLSIVGLGFCQWPLVGLGATQSNTLDEYLVAHGEKVFVCEMNKKRQKNYSSKKYANKQKTKLVWQDEVQEVIEKGGYLGPCAEYGDKRSIGSGYFQTYVQTSDDGTVWGIGFEFPKVTLDTLPEEQYDGLNCYDTNGNGQFDFAGNVGGGDLDHSDECAGGHERVLALPRTDEVAPFKWGLVNWQSHGHTPNGVYDKPHFDFHFYTQKLVERNFIRVGPCALLVNCDDMATGQIPLPDGYMPQDYADVGAVESRMGNHLVDLTTGEWVGEEFTETWIYGAYDGKLTFWEPMITLNYFSSKPFMCKPIKLPAKYHEAGYYPTEYCIRYRESRQDYTVSIEGFVYREAN